MEVASPLPFATGNKRRFACSPNVDAAVMGMDVSSDDYAMEDSSGYHSFKRRRFGSSDMDINQSSSLVPSTLSLVCGGNVSTRASVSSLKRHRVEDSNTTKFASENHELQRTVDKQTLNIERLNFEKSAVVNSYNELKATHEKTVSENKILKRAVTIQQERQNHAAGELDAARKYKGIAEDKMRKLEQLILTLRYHLQAQQPCNDFMGLNNQRPPDVF